MMTSRDAVKLFKDTKRRNEELRMVRMFLYLYTYVYNHYCGSLVTRKGLGTQTSGVAKKRLRSEGSEKRSLNESFNKWDICF